MSREVIPPYDEYNGVPHLPSVPDCDTLSHIPQQREAQPIGPHQYTALKPFPSVCIDHRRLHSWLKLTGQVRLLNGFQALRDPVAFRDFYIDEAKVAAAPPVRVRTVRMPDHLWDQAVEAGVMQSIGNHPSPIPITAAHRAVPDRKRPELGRLISPILQTNDRSRVPDPTPTPLIHMFLKYLMSRKYAACCDYKGWFYAICIALSVSKIWFGAKRGPEFFALVRGLMGWVHTPWLMGSLAQHIAATACRMADPNSEHKRIVPPWLERVQQPGNRTVEEVLAEFLEYDVSQSPGGLLCPVWIDNVFFLCDDPALIEEALLIHQQLCDHLGVTVHEATSVGQHINALGLTAALGDDPRWRVNDDWATGWMSIARKVDPEKSLPLRTLWSVLGGSVWAGYASMFPFSWLRGGFDYLRTLAERWQSKAIGLDDPVPYPSSVRDVVRSVATQLSRRQWRRLTTGMTRFPGFSDAAVESAREGRGFVVNIDGQWLTSSTGFIPARRHINVAELQAAVECFVASPHEPGKAFPLGGDNTCSLFQLYRGSARNPEAETIVRRSYEEAASRGQALAPFHVPGILEPADAPSRTEEPGMGTMSKEEILPAMAVMRHIGLPVYAIADLPSGWHVPPTSAEFHLATAAA
jgi:hypothetical protein